MTTDTTKESIEASIPTRVVLRDLLVEMKQRDVLFESYIKERSKVQARWTLLVGFIALIAGGWMAYLIFDMMDDMKTMSQKMVSMDHSMQYMPSMSNNMESMRHSMQQMNGNIQVMASDMGEMRQYISSVPVMQQAVSQMSQNVQYMQHDTGKMRQGVTDMSRDTHDMGKPFRAMDDFMPW